MKRINKLRLIDKNFYLIINSDIYKNTDETLNYIAAVLNEGVQFIQLKQNNTSTKNFIEIGKRVRELCSIYNAIFIINNRIDIAQIINADGIHLDKNEIDIENANKLTENTMIIGITVEENKDIYNAEKNNADYIINNSSKCIENNIKIPCFEYNKQKKRYVKQAKIGDIEEIKKFVKKI